MPALRRCLLILVAVPLIACASKSKQTPDTGPAAVFYPAPPAAPRLQFLFSFDDGSAWQKKEQSSFAEWVVGTPRRAQTSEGRIENPYGIAAHNGKVYICDVARNRVHVINFVNQEYTLLGNSDLIDNPVNVTIAADGTKYVCDTGRRVVVVFDANDRYVRDIGDAQTCNPMDLAIADDVFYVCDILDREIEVWSHDEAPLRTISKKGPGPDELGDPTNIAIGPNGYLYVTDTLQQIIKIFGPDGNLRNTIGGRGANIGFFARPKGIAIDHDNDVVYISDAQWDVVQMFNTDGDLLMLFGSPGDDPHSMGLPAGIALDSTSIEMFREHLSPRFEPQYLLFLANQFGRNKVSVYAFGRDRTRGEEAYHVDMAEIERLREERRKEMEQNPPQMP